jgi:septum formation protein
MNGPTIWSSKTPLILASNSTIRAELLRKAGFEFSVQTSKIDERTIESDFLIKSKYPSDLAIALAHAKAAALTDTTDGWIIGADQILEFNGQIFHKAKTREEVEKNLKNFAGGIHHLHSAVAILKGQTEKHFFIETASLRMRALTKDDIKNYCDLAGEEILDSVGSYHYEGLGRHLFESVEGREDVIYGLPLDPIIKFFRSAGCLKF